MPYKFPGEDTILNAQTAKGDSIVDNLPTGAVLDEIARAINKSRRDDRALSALAHDYNLPIEVAETVHRKIMIRTIDVVKHLASKI